MTETNYILVPFPPSLYSAMVRAAEEHDAEPHDLIYGWLERELELDDDLEAGEHYFRHMKRRQEREDRQERCGDPALGYQWKSVFLPNGTKLRMTYGGEDAYAEIRHQRLCVGDEHLSPSQFARRVAGNTNRNAWRDLYICAPDRIHWVLADTLRRERR